MYAVFAPTAEIQPRTFCAMKRAFVGHWSERVARRGAIGSSPMGDGECGMGTDQLKDLKRLQK